MAPPPNLSGTTYTYAPGGNTYVPNPNATALHHATLFEVGSSKGNRSLAFAGTGSGSTVLDQGAACASLSPVLSSLFFETEPSAVHQLSFFKLRRLKRRASRPRSTISRGH